MFSGSVIVYGERSDGDLKEVLESFNSKLPKRRSAISYEINYKDLQLGKELGRGSYGVVYQGTWRKHASVAIKQLLSDDISDEARREFEAESQIMARLRSPHIVQFYGYCVSPKYCIVMEHMSNGSLFDVLRDKKRPLDWTIRIRIATDIASGVAFLHQENIIHRDIKSLNVLLNESYGARLTDFGLSKVKTETKSKAMATKTSKEAVGTIAWMAPELFERRAVYTQKSDIYSLGITFWELAASKIPFADASNPALIPSWVSQGEREDIPKECPLKLASLIKACWEGSPDKRPDADAVVTYLKSSESDFGEFLPLFSERTKVKTRMLKSDPALRSKSKNDLLQSSPKIKDLKNISLIDAIKANNQGEVLRLLRLGKKIIDAVDAEYEGGALYWAAAFGYVHFIDPLLNAGVNINKQDKDGRTPVYKAAQNGHAEMITALKAAGGNVNTPHDEKTPVYAAVQQGHVAAVTALLEVGADASVKTPWGTALERAKRGEKSQHLKIVKILEAHFRKYPKGLKPVKDVRNHVRDNTSDEDISIDSDTIEEIARDRLKSRDSSIETSDADETEHSYKRGDSLERKKSPTTLTHFKQVRQTFIPSMVGDLTEFRRLLSIEELDVAEEELFSIVNRNWRYPEDLIRILKRDIQNLPFWIFYRAAQNGHIEVIEVLKAAGVNINNFIFKAASDGDVSAIITLVATGADVDTLDSRGCAPIYIAAESGHPTAVTALLDAGADAKFKTSGWFGSTALDVAQRGKQPGHPEVARLLKAHLKRYPNGIKPVKATKKEIVLHAKSF